MDKSGLTTIKAKELLEKHGLNKLPEKKPPSGFVIFLSQFKNPLIYVLLVAAGVTTFLKEYADTTIILIAVVVNTILGFLQESKAGKALEALKKLIHPYAKVIRDAQIQKIEAEFLVPGDVVILHSGDKIPADGVLIEESRFYVSEAVLTGESSPVLKKVDDKVFMGTVVTTGTAKMYVQVTGAKTQIGKIATSVSGISEDTPLKKQLEKFSKGLSILVLVLIGIIFVVGLLTGQDPVHLFTTSVALAVSAIPEGLLVGLTVVLAIGMQRILAKKGLVRNLVSAETLGGVTTLCVDKTGTLTEGKMRAVDFIGSKEDLSKQVILANDLDDPIVLAAWDWGGTKIKDTEDLLKKHTRLDSLPFSSDKRYFASLNVWNKDENMVFVNGAPEVLIKCSTLTKKEKDKLYLDIEKLTSKGHRLLGFARKSVYKGKDHLSYTMVEKDLEWVGLIAFDDPIRKDVKVSLKKTKKAGIKLIVITGDYAATAEAVLNNLGMNIKKEHILLGEDLEGMSEGELDHILDTFQDVLLFARTKPDQKLRIVQALKNNGEVVAMMGDGVNDAPALKKADIGIVVEEATDVAKESSDLVLLDSSFSTIVAAIEEGRGIFDNIRKIILYLMSDAFGGILIILFSFILKIPAPLTAVQILWINLISDGFPDLALALDPKNKSLMSKPPRDPKEFLVTSWMYKLMGLVSLLSSVFALALFIYLYKENLALARSVVFAAFGLCTLMYVFSVRTLQEPFWKENLFENKWLIGAVFLGLALQVTPFVYPPLGFFLDISPIGIYWVHAVVLSVFVFLSIEVSKWSFRHHLKK